MRRSSASPWPSLSPSGSLGVYRYVDNYWLYRGFRRRRTRRTSGRTGRPSASTWRARRSAAGASRSTSTCRPATSRIRARRYPVLYLLHGEPGRPGAFLSTVRMGVVEDELVAAPKAQPADPRDAVRLDRIVHRQGVGERRPAGQRLGDVRRPRRRARDRRALPDDSLAARHARSPASPRAATARSTSGSTIPASSASSRAGRATQQRRRHRARSSATDARCWRRTRRSTRSRRAPRRSGAAHDYFWFYSGNRRPVPAPERGVRRARSRRARLPHRFFARPRRAQLGALARQRRARLPRSRVAEAPWLRRARRPCPVAARRRARGDRWLYLVRPACRPAVGEALPLDELVAARVGAACLALARLGRDRGSSLGASAALGARRAADGGAPARARGRRCGSTSPTASRSRSSGRSRLRDALHVAARLQASTSPAALVGLGGALLGRPRAARGRARRSSPAWSRPARRARRRCTRSCRATTTGLSAARARRGRAARARGRVLRRIALLLGRAGLRAAGGAPGRSRAVAASRRPCTCSTGSNHGTLASAVVLIALVARRTTSTGPGDAATRRRPDRAARDRRWRDRSATAPPRSG